MFRQEKITWLLAILFLAITIFFGFTIEQKNFQFPLYFLWFGIYVIIFYRTKNKSAVHFFLLTAILARFVLIPAFPLLSDDIYRFIWDGRLWIQGENPFDHLPIYWQANAPESYNLSQSLFSKLNSPEYFTIYPPVCQGIFTLSQWIAGNSVAGSAIVMKLFLVGFELGSLYFIYNLINYLKLPLHLILLYALNPLIIIEISGNLHFEGAMIFFLSAAIWMLVKNRWVWSAILLAFSVASKLLPLMFLPIILNYYGWKKGIKYVLLVGISCLLLFAPLISNTFLQNFGSSLDLYFQKFEFNASIYYCFRWIGQKIVGYNLIKYIGPALAIATLLIILFLAFRKKIQDIQHLLLLFFFAFSVYLFLGTTIHPWYLSTLIFLSVFLPFKYPILWSLLIMLTYISYNSQPFQENLWLVSVEYILMFTLFLIEMRSRNFSLHNKEMVMEEPPYSK